MYLLFLLLLLFLFSFFFFSVRRNYSQIYLKYRAQPEHYSHQNPWNSANVPDPKCWSPDPRFKKADVMMQGSFRDTFRPNQTEPWVHDRGEMLAKRLSPVPCYIQKWYETSIRWINLNASPASWLELTNCTTGAYRKWTCSDLALLSALLLSPADSSLLSAELFNTKRLPATTFLPCLTATLKWDSSLDVHLVIDSAATSHHCTWWFRSSKGDPQQPPLHRTGKDAW